MRTSLSSRRSGFTLIEVAIALALFVIGALAIVRIFPPALGVIRNNESRATAVAMGESTLAKLRNKTSQPPEAVFDVEASSTEPYKWQDFPDGIVSSASKSITLPKQPTDASYDASALGHFRYIYGEPHYIASGQSISLNQPQDSSVAALSGIEFFVDRIIDGVQINANGYLDFANAYYADNPSSVFRGSGYTDPGDVNTVRPPNTMRSDEGVTYYVSYRWRECLDPNACTTFSSIKGVLEEPLDIPDDTASYNTGTDARVLACMPPGSSGNKAIPGGVQVRIRQKFTLAPSATSTGLGADSSRKIVSIKNTGSSGATLYCSYWASDWRNLVGDDAPLNDVVHLPVNGLDTSSIFGILTNSNRTLTPTLVTPDLSTKAKIDGAKKGDVEFTGSSATTSARIVTVYKALDGWARQVSVAPRSYISYDANRGTTTLSSNINFPREPWREYYWNSGDTMYFHPGDAGKTVALSFYDGSGNKVSSICTIDEDLIGIPTGVPSGFIGPGNTSSQVARLFITDASGNKISASSILSVQGLSIRARTAWLNNDRYNQVIVPGYRSLVSGTS
jgi:prepilin-type N-terminal cleavage/methylation domain-containing protein